MVPTMIAMLFDHPDFRPERLASLSDLVYGASPMPAGLLDRLQSLLPGTGLWQGYGMTECSSVLTFLSDEDHRTGGPRLRSAGRPMMGVGMTILDKEGRPVERGRDGEICARAGNFMQKYWHRPEETEAAFEGGWYHTGDEGHQDADGYVYLVDRVKDMIVTGGENVYSTEVEDALYLHPAVLEAAVYGVPDPRWGEAVHASVVPRRPVSADELVEHCRRLIAGYKLPRHIELRTEPLPKSGAGKILKRELRDRYWAADGVRVGGA
jgi:long-chain acyl-CoA synthetase